MRQGVTLQSVSEIYRRKLKTNLQILRRGGEVIAKKPPAKITKL